MKHSLSILGLLIWSAVALLLQTDLAAAERRVALVLGNSAYQSASLNLTNPKNDAEDVAAALKGLGFEVVVETDVSLSDTNRALQEYAPHGRGGRYGALLLRWSRSAISRA